MKIKINAKNASMLVLATTLTSNLWAGAIEDQLTNAGLTPFVANTPAVAAEVNGNIAQILNKISEISPSQNEVTVDCSTDSSLLREALDNGAKQVSFTGACNGPIYTKGAVKLIGSGANTSSINGFVDGGEYIYKEVIWNKSGELRIDNTTIANGVITGSDIIVVASAYGGVVDLRGVDILGPNAGNDDSICLFGRSGSFRLKDVNNSGCNDAIYLSDNSFAELSETGAGKTVIENNRADYWAIHVTRNSSLRMKGGLVKGHLTTDPQDAEVAIGITYNSNIRIKGGVAEGLVVQNNSSADLRGGEVNDKIRLRGESSAKLSKSFKLTQSTTATAAAPVLRVQNGTIEINELENTLNLSYLRANGQSRIKIYGDNINDQHNVGLLRSGRYSALDLWKITVNATEIDISNSDLAVDQSVLNSSGAFNFYNSQGYVEETGSSISSQSSDGVGCDSASNHAIIFASGAVDNIGYPTCP